MAQIETEERKSNTLIGVAGVHYVVSELSRRGLIALPTIRNVAAYDIICSNRQGTWHANIQVKASSKCVDSFPMPPVDMIRDGSRDYYVLVRWLESEKRNEAFLLTGRQAREAVKEHCERQAVSLKKGNRKVDPWPRG